MTDPAVLSPAATAAGSETHSNSSGASSGGSKSELVKECNPITNVRHPDMATGKSNDGTQIASLRFHQNGALKPDNPVAEITYTRACDLQSRKPSMKVDGSTSFSEIIYRS
jgi:hypothetical protein